MFTLPDEPEQGNLLTPEASKVTQNTICIVVKKGRFGTKRQASTSDITIRKEPGQTKDSDKALVTLSKRILDSPELKEVQQLDGQMASFLKGLCLKSMFRGGVYLIPIGLVEEVNSALLDFAEKREKLVETACSTYDQRCTETSVRLQVLHDAQDYPTQERFKQKFYFEWQFVTWETPTRLRAIRPALFEVERQKAAIKLSAVADECKNAMRAGMAELVDHLVERMQPDDDGKKKRFSKRTIENFNEFFRTFELKNVTDDAELAGIVTKAKSVLSGLDAKALKEDAIRTAVTQQFAILKAQLAPMKIDRGSRTIDLDDEDVDDDI